MIIKSIMQEIRQRSYIHKVYQGMQNDTLFKGLMLNSIRSAATHDAIMGKISFDFYEKIFCGGNMSTPWWEINKENIKNYYFKV